MQVTSPHKVGEGMSSYMTYKVSTKTNVNYFKKSEMSVDRRFSDFLGLHDKLSEKYLQNGRIIPPAPDKSVVGMTRVKMSKESDTEVVIQDEVRINICELYCRKVKSDPSRLTPPLIKPTGLYFFNFSLSRNAALH